MHDINECGNTDLNYTDLSVLAITVLCMWRFEKVRWRIMRAVPSVSRIVCRQRPGLSTSHRLIALPSVFAVGAGSERSTVRGGLPTLHRKRGRHSWSRGFQVVHPSTWYSAAEGEEEEKAGCASSLCNSTTSTRRFSCSRDAPSAFAYVHLRVPARP